MNHRGWVGFLLLGVLVGCGGTGTPGASSGLAGIPGTSPSFKIDLNIVNSVSSSQQAIFQQAAARWQQVITVGLPATTLTVNTDSSNTCDSSLPAYSGPVNSVRIDLVVKPMDGVGGTLGSSGPCLIRSSSNLPIYGVITLDSADVNDLENRGLLLATVTHEMAHVLGFGTLWNEYGRALATGVGNGASCGNNPQFVGTNALREWQRLGGTGNIPLETGGELGTCDSHWSKAVFGDELMTGYIGSKNPLSRVTIGSMQDLGYTVNYGAADAYSLPSATRTQSLAQPWVTRLIHPIGVVNDRK